MYFIARNNKIYNYIAYMPLMNRYAITFGVIVTFFIGGFYLVYYPLNDYIILYKAQRVILQKKYDELIQMKKKENDLLVLIEENKKNTNVHALSIDKHNDACHTRILFVLDTIIKFGLKLNAYGSRSEKDKKWYVKNKAHFDIVGSKEKIIAFLEAIKDAGTMITMSYATITRIDDTAFQIGCDLGLITVKK
jgi:hypothetical protein